MAGVCVLGYFTISCNVRGSLCWDCGARRNYHLTELLTEVRKVFTRGPVLRCQAITFEGTCRGFGLMLMDGALYRRDVYGLFGTYGIDAYGRIALRAMALYNVGKDYGSILRSRLWFFIGLFDNPTMAR